MLFINISVLLLCMAASAYGCMYGNKQKVDGETWVVRSFLMRCTIRPDDSWFTTVVGCLTPQGSTIRTGENAIEGDQVFECGIGNSGNIEMNTHFAPEAICDGHAIGESWISKKNFNKSCEADGAIRIMNCLTDNGTPLALSSTFTESNVIYSCTENGNGMVILERKTNVMRRPEVPFGPLPPSEPFQPRFPLSRAQPPAIIPPPHFNQKQGNGGETSDSSSENEAVLTNFLTSPTKQEIFCVDDNGMMRNPEETWIYEDKFTKKCTPTGAVIILNCVINENISINIDSTVRIGKKIFTCSRKQGTVFYEEKTA